MITLIPFKSNIALGAQFFEEIERVIPLRSNGELQITNNRGDISIEGWAQDRVRLRAKRRAEAENLTEAKKLFGAMDIRHAVTSGDIEISAEYGHGLSLQERLKERATPRSSMEMNVLAPASLRLRVWAANGRVYIHGWKGPLEVRSGEGAIRIQAVSGESVSLMCAACEISASEVQTKNLRVMGGGGGVALKEVNSEHIYVESENGAIRAEKTQGEQLFVSRAGEIRLIKPNGHIEFHTQGGQVEILDGMGFLSGKTQTGNITARMRAWSFEDKAIVETHQGNISMELPSVFSGELDLWSGVGGLKNEFLIQKGEGTRNLETPDRHFGVVGEGGEVLRIHSEKGTVSVTRGK